MSIERALKRRYLVAADHRTGGRMLCNILAGTGVAGLPDEHILQLRSGYGIFNPERDADIIALLPKPPGAVADRDFIAAALAEGSAGGVFGTRIVLPNFIKLAERLGGLSYEETLRRLTPELKIVHLMRRDKVAQAVSYWAARQSRKWHAGEQEQREPIFHFRAIDIVRRELEKWDAEWCRIFGEVGVVPHTVVYEKLVKDPESTVRDVLGFLELPDDGPVPPATTERQFGERSAEWIGRYRRRRLGAVGALQPGAASVAVAILEAIDRGRKVIPVAQWWENKTRCGPRSVTLALKALRDDCFAVRVAGTSRHAVPPSVMQDELRNALVVVRARTRRADESAYARLADRLRADILNGRLARGQALAGPVQLGRDHGVSMVTAGHAVWMLAADGLLLPGAPGGNRTATVADWWPDDAEGFEPGGLPRETVWLWHAPASVGWPHGRVFCVRWTEEGVQVAPATAAGDMLVAPHTVWPSPEAEVTSAISRGSRARLKAAVNAWHALVGTVGARELPPGRSKLVAVPRGERPLDLRLAWRKERESCHVRFRSGDLTGDVLVWVEAAEILLANADGHGEPLEADGTPLPERVFSRPAHRGAAATDVAEGTYRGYFRVMRGLGAELAAYATP